MINELIGKVITRLEGDQGSDELHFYCADGSHYQMVYHQDCCACCSIESIDGDLTDLVDSMIVDAREESKDASDDRDANDQPTNTESATWTFYIIQSLKGAVTIRWYGSSNGYYSESATFEKVRTH